MLTHSEFNGETLWWEAGEQGSRKDQREWVTIGSTNMEPAPLGKEVIPLNLLGLGGYLHSSQGVLTGRFKASRHEFPVTQWRSL